eukprot:13476487-Ditylum_brightwellii.AAC.1
MGGFILPPGASLGVALSDGVNEVTTAPPSVANYVMGNSSDAQTSHGSKCGVIKVDDFDLSADAIESATHNVVLRPCMALE